ncbi:MAG: hypothetical protein IJ849_09575 [Selenomonadaceae bacterium]|nr:hypothetical protein [Selenomonadaceae bacterium]
MVNLKKQYFEYMFSKPKEGSLFINARHLQHAICNSDQFPSNPIKKRGEPYTPEERAMHLTLEAVFAAIDATPKYVLRDSKLEKEPSHD